MPGKDIHHVFIHCISRQTICLLCFLHMICTVEITACTSNVQLHSVLYFQISGKKQVVLFEPFDNTKLYEAHIPQATLKYSKLSGTFRRHGLEDTTSMVMSPIDILNPDFKVKVYFTKSTFYCLRYLATSLLTSVYFAEIP